MEQFHYAARGLQRTLIDLRRSRDRLREGGEEEKAAALDKHIERIEQVLKGLPEALRPPTLQ